MQLKYVFVDFYQDIRGPLDLLLSFPIFDKKK